MAMTKQPRLLIAGSSGFIGQRLTAELVDRNLPLRCLARRVGPPQPGVEAVAVDLLDQPALTKALQGIDTAYYLVHSLNAGERHFAGLDRTAAENFVAAAEACGLRRLIYLSGLGQAQNDLSSHLQSRAEVAEILGSGSFQTTVLRAAIIIGAGGASFEMLRFLVKTQLLLPEIEWLATRCQPIAVANVVGYLVGCLDDERTAGQSFDIGGPEVLTYRDMLETFAGVAKTKNIFLPFPGYSPRIAASLIGALSSIDSKVSLALLEGMANEVVCTEERIRQLIPQRLISYADAVRMALKDRARAT
jgi:uncharacterized protein YbjT (DUF2867 family)